MSESKMSAGSYRNLARRRFTREFKRQVVEQLLHSGLTVAEVAREHALHPNQLCRWRGEYRRRAGPVPAVTQALQQLLPVTFGSEPEAGQAPRPAAGELSMRLTLARGKVEVLNGCTPELLRIVIKALQ